MKSIFLFAPLAALLFAAASAPSSQPAGRGGGIPQGRTRAAAVTVARLFTPSPPRLSL